MIFLNSASSAAALEFYLPGVCTHTDTGGKQRKVRGRNNLKSSEKNTIFNEHPVYASGSSMSLVWILILSYFLTCTTAEHNKNHHKKHNKASKDIEVY